MFEFTKQMFSLPTNFSNLKSIKDITNLSLKDKEALFSNRLFRHFCRSTFLSTSFIESNSYDIDDLCQIVFFYCTNRHYGLHHNLRNLSLIKRLQPSKIKNLYQIDYMKCSPGRTIDDYNHFLMGLIHEKMFISIKTLDDLMKELTDLKKTIFEHCIYYYIEFIISENGWLNGLLEVWNNNCSIEDEFPIQTLIKSFNFEYFINTNISKTKHINKNTVIKIVTDFENRRRKNLILILSRKTKMNFETKLIFGFLFGTKKFVNK